MYVSRRPGAQQLARNQAHAGAVALAASERAALAEGWRYVGDLGEPSFGAGWANTVDRVAFYLDTQGFVLLAGLATKIDGSDLRMFTLPAGYRPGRRLEFSATNQGKSYVIATVYADGQVRTDSLFDAGLRLDGIMFRTN